MLTVSASARLQIHWDEIYGFCQLTVCGVSVGFEILRPQAPAVGAAVSMEVWGALASRRNFATAVCMTTSLEMDREERALKGQSSDFHAVKTRGSQNTSG